MAGVLRRSWPVLFAVAAVGAIVVAVNPREVGRALREGDAVLLVPAIVLGVAVLVAQGVRWHQLLRVVGAPLSAVDSVLLSVAGQGITAILPLGDLTRAVFVTEVTDIAFADVVATVTVQELSFTLLLLGSAAPVVVERRSAAAAEIVALAGIAVVLAILLVPAVFHQVHRAVAHTPLIRRFTAQIDELQHETVVLLHRGGTLAWSLVDLLRVLLSVTAFWLVIRALTHGGVGWASAAFVLALSYVGGAISLVPGGVGANEASVVGLLIVVGVSPPAAAAIALVQRLVSSGTAIACAIAAYVVARRRFPALSSPASLRHRPQKGWSGPGAR